MPLIHPAVAEVDGRMEEAPFPDSRLVSSICLGRIVALFLRIQAYSFLS